MVWTGSHSLALQLAQYLRARGDSFQTVASELNRLGLPCVRGGRWYGASVRVLLVQARDPHRNDRQETQCTA